MATTPPKQDPRTVVRSSTTLWTDVVGRANAEEVIEPYDPAYNFSNGRKFVEKDHYGQREQMNTTPPENG